MDLTNLVFMGFVGCSDYYYPEQEVIVGIVCHEKEKEIIKKYIHNFQTEEYHFKELDYFSELD